MSAIIDSVDYDKQTKTLSIDFVQGGHYVYEDVPESVYIAFMSAPSRGKFFWANIRDKYSNTRS